MNTVQERSDASRWTSDAKIKEIGMLEYTLESELYDLGYKYVCGVDEAGRGPLCGPVVAAACILPCGLVLPGLNDSKKLSEKKS